MRVLAIALAVALLLAGCKKNHQSSVVQTNKEEPPAPGIAWTSPAHDETGVALDVVVTVTFTEDMNPATFTTTSFTVSPSGGPPLAGAVAYIAGSHQAQFTPAAPLLPFTTYIVHLTTFIQTAKGVSLGVGQFWSFKTGP